MYKGTLTWGTGGRGEGGGRIDGGGEGKEKMEVCLRQHRRGWMVRSWWFLSSTSRDRCTLLSIRDGDHL